MYIGQAAKESGATVKAIRLYEEMGLLPTLTRENSYRVFTEETVLLIKFIKIAQTFDFKLNELKNIIHPDGESANWKNIEEAIQVKEQAITKEILRLENNRSQLIEYKNEIMQCLKEHQDCHFPNNKTAL